MIAQAAPHQSSPKRESAETMGWNFVVGARVFVMIFGCMVLLFR